MAKVVISARISPGILQALEEHNDIRASLGLPRLSIGKVLDDAIPLWISEDRQAIRRKAEDTLSRLAGEP